MKKLIFVLALLVSFTFVNAQNATYTGADNQTYLNVSTDHTLTNTTAKWFEFVMPNDWPCAQVLVVNIDSTGGNHTNVAMAVYGRNSSLESWTAIGSAINWKGTTSDTTITFANTTENRYRRYKVLFTGTGTGTSKVDNMELKLYRPD